MDTYDEIVAELVAAGAVKSQMFGMPCLKIGKKIFAGFYSGDLVVKLPPDAYAKALQLPGALPFAPGKRVMSGWLQVSPAVQDQWRELAKTALAYVADLKS